MAGKQPMISRRWLINYVLILLIVVFTFIGNRYQVKTGYQPENRISTLKAQDIERIAIKTADSAIELQKTGANWMIDSPIRWQADNITIERILGIVNAETDSRLASDQIDLSTLGLQFPKAVLRLNDTDFLFGATNNIGERRYLLSNNTVFLLPDQFLPFFSEGISALIDRRLLPRSQALQSLDLGAIKFNKVDNNWQAKPSTIDTEQMDQLLANWQTQQAARIQNYQPGMNPKQKIIAELDDGERIEFYLLSISPEIILARPDLNLQYHFKENQYYGLLATGEK